MSATLVGYLAAFLTTVSFVPQVVHTLRTRDVTGISLIMYIAFTAGVFCWLVYGLVIAAWPIVIANALTFVLAAIVLTCKITLDFRRRRLLRAAARQALGVAPPSL